VRHAISFTTREEPRLAAARVPAAPEIRMVLRPPQRESAALDAFSGDIIAPIQRGLAVLAAFRGGDEWLGNQEIAHRTNIPKATVTRLTHTLATERFLNHSSRLRKYRLAPAVLTLGFATAHSSDVAGLARPPMQSLADDCGVFVGLATRNDLNIVIVESCHSATRMLTLAVGNGASFPLTSSPPGLALLSGLAATEREYLLERARQRCDAAGRLALRQRFAHSAEQVLAKGYCVAAGDWGADITVAGAPLILPDLPAFAIFCAAPRAWLTRARLADTVGPRLAGLVQAVRKSVAQAATTKESHAG
jgi:DNA-binding IclR family transcriptional regulator